MSNPVHIKTIIVEFNLRNISVLREALENYHKYLKDVLLFEHETPLTKQAIEKRIKYIEDFLERIEL